MTLHRLLYSLYLSLARKLLELEPVYDEIVIKKAHLPDVAFKVRYNSNKMRINRPDLQSKKAV